MKKAFSMKKAVSMFLCLILASVCMCAAAEESASFGLPENVAFGDGEEKIMQAVGDGNPDEWRTVEIGKWKLMASSENISLAGVEAMPIFFLMEDQMEMYACDFVRAVPDGGYDRVLEALTAEYGESQPVSAADVAQLMSCINPGFYQEDDITSQVMWQLEDITVYLFCYSEDSFTVFMINPAWDYGI